MTAATRTRPAAATTEIDLCDLDWLIPGRGVAALAADGRQIAVFLLSDGTLRALDNIDPFSRAAVVSRGLVGDHGGVPCVMSPIGKQAFALDDGRCLDDESVRLDVFEVRVVDGRVRVDPRPVRDAGRRAA